MMIQAVRHFPSFLLYLVVRFFSGLIGFLPYKFLWNFSGFCGNILYILPGFGSLCRINLHAAFPEKDDCWLRMTARKSLQHLAMTMAEFFWIRKHPEKFASLVDLTEAENTAAEGLAHVRAGEGNVFVTPHFGNWEFAGRVLAQIYGYPMATVVRTARNPYLDRLISDGRCSGNVRIIHSKGGALAMCKALQEGCTLGILIDQNTRVRDGGVFVNLFGMPIPVSRAPGTLARKNNRYVAIGTVLRTEHGKYRGILRSLPKPASEYASDIELVQALTSITEEFIRLAPEQYLWMYKRFQYIPEGVSDEVRKRFPAYAVVPGPHFYSRTHYH